MTRDIVPVAGLIPKDDSGNDSPPTEHMHEVAAVCEQAHVEVSDVEKETTEHVVLVAPSSEVENHDDSPRSEAALEESKLELTEHVVLTVSSSEVENTDDSPRKEVVLEESKLEPMERIVFAVPSSEVETNGDSPRSEVALEESKLESTERVVLVVPSREVDNKDGSPLSDVALKESKLESTEHVVLVVPSSEVENKDDSPRSEIALKESKLEPEERVALAVPSIEVKNNDDSRLSEVALEASKPEEKENSELSATKTQGFQENSDDTVSHPDQIVLLENTELPQRKTDEHSVETSEPEADLPKKELARGMCSRSEYFFNAPVSVSYTNQEKQENARKQIGQNIKTKASTQECSDEVKLHRAANAWRAIHKRSRFATDPELMSTDDLYKRIRGILNKLTPQKFQMLVEQVSNLTINTEERLKGVIDMVFETAISEPMYSVAYANLCKCLALLKVPVGNKENDYVNFRKLLLNKCQKEFERDITDEVAKKQRLKDIDAAETEEEKKILEEDYLNMEKKAKQRSLGNIM